MRISVFMGVVLLAFGASAAGLPEFDIKSLCSRVAEPSTIDLDECIDNERVARDALKARVESLPEERIRDCLKSLSEGHDESYLALLGCIVSSDKKEGSYSTIVPSPSKQNDAIEKAVPAPEPSPLATSAELPRATRTAGALVFSHDLALYSRDPDVKRLQIFLNRHGFPIAADGPGSPGSEVEIFGLATKAALEKFQKAHAKELGITSPSGNLGEATRKYINGLE
jgi:hypothetical protein